MRWRVWAAAAMLAIPACFSRSLPAQDISYLSKLLAKTNMYDRHLSAPPLTFSLRTEEFMASNDVSKTP